MDLAARAEAKRRLEEGYGATPRRRPGLVANLVALAFGLAAIGVVLYLAWQSGLIALSR
jgi:hypothetical protein